MSKPNNNYFEVNFKNSMLYAYAEYQILFNISISIERYKCKYKITYTLYVIVGIVNRDGSMFPLSVDNCFN